MSSAQSSHKRPVLRVRNVGGISETEVELTPGVNALTGRNATNRTSLLQAIMAALGSERVSLKGDAKEGHAELTIGEKTYTRSLERRDGQVVTGGEPYLEDAELADLFAFLLESNEARRAVTRGDDLRELIMRPVDTNAIQAEIERLEDEKRRLDAELEELDAVERELPELESKRNRVESDLEEVRERLADKEEEIETASADVDESREQKSELEGKLGELRNARSDLEDARFDLESERASLEALREEQGDLEADLEELPESPAGDVEELETRIEELRERRRQLDSEVNELQHLIQFNEEMLSEGTSPFSTDDEGDDGGAVTDQLVADSESVVCWTCGSSVDDSQIEATVERLRELRRQKLDERSDVTDELDDLADERASFEAEQRHRRQLVTRQASIEDEIDRRESNVEDLQARREELSEGIEDLESAVENLESQEHSDILDLHREANQLEFEIGRLEDNLASIEKAIIEKEDRVDDRGQIEGRREGISEELADLRTRVERVEEGAIEEFNEHMATVLDILDYANIERIWIERSERRVREGRRTVQKSAFDLHVIRSTDSGATYEDTIDHLSESEREVTGLVFALAGYLVHDVHETVPFMLLDSLEAVDSERIAALIDYIAKYANFLIVALLPEDAAALDDKHHRVTKI